jgi:hypothetical protein
MERTLSPSMSKSGVTKEAQISLLKKLGETLNMRKNQGYFMQKRLSTQRGEGRPAQRLNKRHSKSIGNFPTDPQLKSVFMTGVKNQTMVGFSNLTSRSGHKRQLTVSKLKRMKLSQLDSQRWEMHRTSMDKLK